MGSTKVICDVKDDPVLHVIGQEPSMPSKYTASSPSIPVILSIYISTQNFQGIFLGVHQGHDVKDYPVLHVYGQEFATSSKLSLLDPQFLTQCIYVHVRSFLYDIFSLASLQSLTFVLLKPYVMKTNTLSQSID